MKKNEYVKDRSWAEVARDLEAVDKLHEYGQAVFETGIFRLKLTLVAPDGSEEEVSDSRNALDEEGPLPSEFWIKVHQLMWKYTKPHQKALKREMAAMTLRQ